MRSRAGRCFPGLAVIGCGLGLGFVNVLQANAATLTVRSLADSGAAIDASSDGGTINFAVTGVIGLTSGQLTVMTSVNIVGPGAAQLEVTRGNSSAFRIFQTGTTGAPNKVVAISGLAITKGRPGFDSATLGNDGGILNYCNLTLTNCVISNNTGDTSGGTGGGVASRGAFAAQLVAAEL